MRECRIVPAIDLLNGCCVRLQQGDFEKVDVFGDNPVQVARKFEEQGFRRVHLVDLDGARKGTPCHLDVVRAIARETSLTIDVSGGIRTRQSVEQMLESGAVQVVVGSMAVIDPDEVIRWIESFGGESIVLGLDVLGDDVRIKGWQESGAVTLASVLEQFRDTGIQRVMSTDISRDGMLEGPSVKMYGRLCQEYPLYQFIASGGVASADDVRALAETGVKEVVVGKALYTGSLRVSDVEDFVW